MSLRRKKTGEIVEIDGIHVTKDDEGEMFDSIAELIEEYEDYKPAEPYIDNNLVRALVRSWAYFNNVDKVEYNYYPADDNCSFIFTYDDGLELLLDFRCKIDNLISGKTYTITELIGEEEDD